MLDELGDILGIQFRGDVSIRYLNLESIGSEKRLRKEGNVLHLNLSALDKGQQKAVLELVREQFHSKGRVLRLDKEEEANAMEAAYSDELDEIREFFDGVVSDRYHDILDRSLHLRAVIESQHLSKTEIQERKGQIARRYGSDAIYLSSLVSAGYFDPNGGLRDLLVDMGLNPELNRANYQRVLSDYVDKKLFAYFVESDESVYNATQEVRGGLSRYQKEKPIHDWFDIRGIGENCATIIDGVITNLDEEFISLNYNERKDGDSLWYRIYPRALGRIS